MPKLVFLCVANSARSQMAEGLARATAPDGWEIYSAGSEPAALHPLAVRVMGEAGIDIGHHRAKGMDAVPLADADVVITLCAEEQCPVAYTRGRRLSWPFPDPAGVPPGEAVARFRDVRDAIARRINVFWRAEAATA